MKGEVKGLIGLFLVLFDYCLLLWLKFWGARGASHHSALMGCCQTISYTFYSSNYPVDEGNEDLGKVWDNILLFFCLVQIKVIALASNPGREGAKVSANITELQKSLKCQ